MKNILIYGDSNTWGDNLITNKRIPYSKRWPTILSKSLGSKYLIIPEGLPGRLAGNKKFRHSFKSGKMAFEAIYQTHSPLDIIIIALGTNDLLQKNHKATITIIRDLEWYSKKIQSYYSKIRYRERYLNGKLPHIIYIMPTKFVDITTSKRNNEKIEKKRNKIIRYFEQKKYNIIIPDNIKLLKDSIHFNYKGHEEMSEIVYKKIVELK